MKKIPLLLAILIPLLLSPLQAGTIVSTSAAAGASNFSDVPAGYWAWQWIESLYQAHLTSGCLTDPLRYCPENTVKRAEMAVFLERGIHGASYLPPVVPLTFGDISGHWARYWIQALSTDGITSGCGSGNYCPESATTRAEMAIFLLRARHGAAYNPPPATGTRFADVPAGHWAAAWIEQLAAEGITTGCGNGNYCPNSSGHAPRWRFFSCAPSTCRSSPCQPAQPSAGVRSSRLTTSGTLP